MVWNGTVWCGMALYAVEWHRLVWNGTVWCGMALYGAE